jgi:protease-4
MSNAAASGGYYIAMSSKRIFANPMTLTGSIGVFGIKFDASEFAKSYGVTGDYHPRGSHAAAENPLTPLTPGMKENIARTVRDYYDYFKAIVATGRAMSVDDVEEVARGRVWTGEQAREVGLVDALGGLDRAVSYARKTYATTDRVEVDHYPRRSSMWDVLQSSRGSSYMNILRASFAVMLGFGNGGSERGSVEKLLGGLSELKFAKTPHFMLTMDEETAVDVIMKGDWS